MKYILVILVFSIRILVFSVICQETNACSKSTIETLEKDAKYFQS